MKKPFIYFSTLICIIVAACSSDYDYSTDINSDEINFVTLKTTEENKRTFGNEETVSFLLFNDSNNQNVSEAATFYVDGEAILGNEFVFSETGTYNVNATINNVESNTLEITIVSNNYIFIDKSKVLKDQTVNFKSFNNSGNEITEESTFFVDNNPINGNSFQSEQLGTYEVKAQYQGSTSTAANFKIYSPKRKVVLEDYTGDWCGWCPRVLLVVEEVADVTDDIVVLAIHKNDAMEFSQADALIDFFNIGSSLPKLRANRTENINVIQDSQIPIAVENIASQAGVESSIGLAIKTKLDGSRANIEIDIISEESIPANYKLAVYLYQDGLIFPQTNYYNGIEGSEWYQAGDPIEDFEHNHVLEASLTNNILGDEIGNNTPYNSLTKKFENINLSNYVHSENGNSFNPNKFGVVAILVDENNNAINGQSVKIGERIDFDE